MSTIKYPTMFAIVSLDNTTEYVNTLKRASGNSYHFVSMLIPHKGKRYKTYANALAMVEKINKESEHPVCKVIEALI